MKNLALFACCFLLQSTAYGQPRWMPKHSAYGQPKEDECQKSISAGGDYLTWDPSRLNELLTAAGYPSLPSGFGVFSFQKETAWIWASTRWGIQFGSNAERDDSTGGHRFNFYRVYYGAGLCFYHRGMIRLTSNTALAFEHMPVRLYRNAVDTNSFRNYIFSGPDDLKRFELSGMTIALGVQCDVYHPKMGPFLISLRGGYRSNIPPVRNSHDSGRFGDEPWTSFRGWYAGLSIGASRYFTAKDRR